jgi:alkanesulfonate monooxygenase SsuD/methylene tetrahydromethanopterin reductase-like flavin-dependent oxidoreductase (luciferase family)
MSVSDIDTTPRRALCFTPMETDRHLIVDAAIRAEELGFEAVIVPEGWGFDSGVVITEIALRTHRIRLVAGVQSPWGRSPAQLAMEAATLADISGGRFVLGLGASTSQLASGLHGSAFERPAVRVADTLDTIRTLLGGGHTTTHDGRDGLRLAIRPDQPVPIWVAGLGPRTVRLALDRADGWFPAFLSAKDLDRRAVTPGPDSATELIVSPAAAVSPDPAFAREVVRQLVGRYLVGMGRLYGDVLADAGYAREVGILRLDNPSPSSGRIVWSSELDHLLDELAVHGDADGVMAQLARWDRRADVVGLLQAPGMGDAVFDLLDAAAPRPTVATAVEETIR